ncbi:proliferating cell nuclear antigen (pcna) [Candidatus Thorarchaeota archaeon]|nr:MAG: proliferating cell nuclear antigen (pcna) [Candidatus Thorarchaeota archaeon]
MFAAVMDSSKTWKQIVDAVATLLTEANLTISPQGITLVQRDSTRAAMIDLSLPRSVFQQYDCDDTYQICIGVDELARVTKRIAVDDRIELRLNEALMRLQIRMIGETVRTFRIRLLTPSTEPEDPINESFAVRAEMAADLFKRVVRDVGVVSDHVLMSATSGGLSFSGSGDIGEAEIELTPGEESLLYSLSGGAATSMYALSYLSEIAKAIGGDELVLQMTGDRPAMFEFPIAESGRIKFLVAPRIQRR